jgi:hypothetical protein
MGRDISSNDIKQARPRPESDLDIGDKDGRVGRGSMLIKNIKTKKILEKSSQKKI